MSSQVRPGLIKRSEFCSINAKFLVNRQPVGFWFRPGRLGKEASKNAQKAFSSSENAFLAPAKA
jgi:hypothetical protein